MAPVSGIFIPRTSLLIPELPTTPYTNPSLTANLVCRVLLALLANAGCWVPLKNLYRQGELATAFFVGTVIVDNFLTVVNALIWRNDNVYEWWNGRLWCDLHAYIYQPLIPLYLCSTVAITRNLAQQMGLSRVSPLSSREERRKRLVQVLIMSPLPLIQMALLYPLSSQRYRIATLAGCIWSNHPSWPFVVFFLLPSPLVVLVAGYYAILTWRRYSKIEKVTRSAFMSNSSAASRASRTRWRIFSLMVCVLVLFIPTYCYLAVVQLGTDFLSRSFEFRKIRQGVEPLPWDTILLLPSSSLNFFQLNHHYLVIATALPIFFFFGMTEDTMNAYSRVLRALGLGHVFPWLREGPVSGRTEQQLEVSWGTQTTLTPMKSARDDSQHMPVSHVSGIRGFVYSSPTMYPGEAGSPAEEVNHPPMSRQASDDTVSTVLTPEPQITVGHSWSCISKNYSTGFNGLRSSYSHGHSQVTLNPFDSLSHDEMLFPDDHSIIISPARAHIRTRSWLNEGRSQPEQANGEARLRRLAPLPSLDVMTHTHIADLSRGTHEPQA